MHGIRFSGILMVRALQVNYDSSVRHGRNNITPYYSSTNMEMEMHQSSSLVDAGTGEFNRSVSGFRFICLKNYQSHPLGVFYGENPLDFAFSLFLFDAILVILITRIVRFLLKPLRQPRIVAEIIGGIIIGPSVLGQSKNFTKHAFPENAQYVVKNIGILGFMFFLFVAGVKMDLSLVKKTGKKHLYTAVIGVFFPMVAVATVGFILRPSMDKELARVSGIGGVSSNLSITAFPAIYLVLKELNLLSSEIGRMALSSAIVGDIMGIAAIVVFEALKQAESGAKNALWYVISSLVLGAFIVTVIRRLLLYIVEKTPEGKPVSQGNIVLILLGVLVMGFLTDMFGIAIANGSLWLGLAIPDGPPLGATVVERCETIMMEILMPFAFALVGLNTDVFAMSEYGWARLSPLFSMVMVGYICKLVATFGVALYFRMPWKDGLTLSFIMNLRGQIELVLFIHWMDKMIMGIPMFTMLVLLTVLMTGIYTLLISILYDPTRPYMVNKRRTIQHTPPGAELRIVVGIQNKESLAALINLLEISHPTNNSPFSIYALHLVELIGRANPLFIDSSQAPNEAFKFADHETIQNALKHYQESRSELIKLYTYTAATAKRSMYQDICELALTKKASLIILPYDRTRLENLAGTELVRHGNVGPQSMNANVLAHAPCSVGILVSKGNATTPFFRKSFRHAARHKYVMLFLGGADAREALIYADRMVANPDVCLLVIRFLAANNGGDDEIEKKLDDGVVTSFWVKNEQNDRVIYREVVVRDGEETLGAIQTLNDNTNDMWIVGRCQGINNVLLQGLTSWSENQELGVIGDFVASVDFGGNASVLVVHQQVMRAQGTETTGAQGSCSCKCSSMCVNLE